MFMCKFRSHQLREHLKKIKPQTINQFSCKPYKVPVDLRRKAKNAYKKNKKREAKFCFAHSNRDMKRKNCNNINFDTFQSFPVMLERKPGNLKIEKKLRP